MAPTTTTDEINLGKGHPNPQYLPLPQVKSAFLTSTTHPTSAISLLQYGPAQGPPALRTAITNWVVQSNTTNNPTNKISPDNILITTGSATGLSLVCQLFTKPGDVIVAESPVYFLALYTFNDCGLKVHEVRSDENGLDVELLERKLKEGLRPKLVYTVPLGNNPIGCTMSESRRKRLIELAREYDFRIAADEVYMFLLFPEQMKRSKSLVCYDDIQGDCRVFSINSFSKILGPGLRMGWMVTGSKYIERMLDGGLIQSGGGLNPLTSGVVVEMMKEGVHLKQSETLRKLFKNNCEVLCQGVNQKVQAALLPGEEAKYVTPTGGYFLWIILPERFDTSKLLELAQKKYDVNFFPGKRFGADGKSYSNCLRLCFAYLDSPALKEGVDRLAQAIGDYGNHFAVKN